MTAQPLSTPFAFDTEFDASGVVLQTSAFRPAKRSYAPLEVDALIAEACGLEERQRCAGVSWDALGSGP